MNKKILVSFFISAAILVGSFTFSAPKVVAAQDTLWEVASITSKSTNPTVIANTTKQLAKQHSVKIPEWNYNLSGKFDVKKLSKSFLVSILKLAGIQPSKTQAAAAPGGPTLVLTVNGESIAVPSGTTTLDFTHHDGQVYQSDCRYSYDFGTNWIVVPVGSTAQVSSSDGATLFGIKGDFADPSVFSEARNATLTCNADSVSVSDGSSTFLASGGATAFLKVFAVSGLNPTETTANTPTTFSFRFKYPTAPVVCSANFGDGSLPVDQTITDLTGTYFFDHTYTADSVYDARISCTNGTGAKGSSITSITVGAGVPTPTISITNDQCAQSGCSLSTEKNPFFLSGQVTSSNGFQSPNVSVKVVKKADGQVAKFDLPMDGKGFFSGEINLFPGDTNIVTEYAYDPNNTEATFVKYISQIVPAPVFSVGTLEPTTANVNVVTPFFTKVSGFADNFAVSCSADMGDKQIVSGVFDGRAGFTFNHTYATEGLFGAVVNCSDTSGNNANSRTDITVVSSTPPDTTPPILENYNKECVFDGKEIYDCGKTANSIFGVTGNAREKESAIALGQSGKPSIFVTTYDPAGVKTGQEVILDEFGNFTFDVKFEKEGAYRIVESVYNTAGLQTVRTKNITYTASTPSDTTPPTVVSIVPAGKAIDVPTNQNIVVTFSEPIASETVNVNTVGLTYYNPPTNSTVYAEVVSSLSADGTVLTIDPIHDFTNSVTYTLTLGALTDLAGNLLDGGFSSSFTTEKIPFQAIRNIISGDQSALTVNSSIVSKEDQIAYANTATSNLVVDLLCYNDSYAQNVQVEIKPGTDSRLSCDRYSSDTARIIKVRSEILDDAVAAYIYENGRKLTAFVDAAAAGEQMILSYKKEIDGKIGYRADIGSGNWRNEIYTPDGIKVGEMDNLIGGHYVEVKNLSADLAQNIYTVQEMNMGIYGDAPKVFSFFDTISKEEESRSELTLTQDINGLIPHKFYNFVFGKNVNGLVVGYEYAQGLGYSAQVYSKANPSYVFGYNSAERDGSAPAQKTSYIVSGRTVQENGSNRRILDINNLSVSQYDVKELPRISYVESNMAAPLANISAINSPFNLSISTIDSATRSADITAASALYGSTTFGVKSFDEYAVKANIESLADEITISNYIQSLALPSVRPGAKWSISQSNDRKNINMVFDSAAIKSNLEGTSANPSEILIGALNVSTGQLLPSVRKLSDIKDFSAGFDQSFALTSFKNNSADTAAKYEASFDSGASYLGTSAVFNAGGRFNGSINWLFKDKVGISKMLSVYDDRYGRANLSDYAEMRGIATFDPSDLGVRYVYKYTDDSYAGLNWRQNETEQKVTADIADNADFAGRKEIAISASIPPIDPATGTQLFNQPIFSSMRDGRRLDISVPEHRFYLFGEPMAFNYISYLNQDGKRDEMFVGKQGSMMLNTLEYDAAGIRALEFAVGNPAVALTADAKWTRKGIQEINGLTNVDYMSIDAVRVNGTSPIFTVLGKNVQNRKIMDVDSKYEFRNLVQGLNSEGLLENRYEHISALTNAAGNSISLKDSVSSSDPKQQVMEFFIRPDGLADATKVPKVAFKASAPAGYTINVEDLNLENTRRSLDGFNIISLAGLGENRVVGSMSDSAVGDRNPINLSFTYDPLVKTLRKEVSSLQHGRATVTVPAMRPGSVWALANGILSFAFGGTAPAMAVTFAPDHVVEINASANIDPDATNLIANIQPSVSAIKPAVLFSNPRNEGYVGLIPANASQALSFNGTSVVNGVNPKNGEITGPFDRIVTIKDLTNMVNGKFASAFITGATSQLDAMAKLRAGLQNSTAELTLDPANISSAVVDLSKILNNPITGTEGFFGYKYGATQGIASLVGKSEVTEVNVPMTNAAGVLTDGKRLAYLNTEGMFTGVKIDPIVLQDMKATATFKNATGGDLYNADLKGFVDFSLYRDIKEIDGKANLVYNAPMQTMQMNVSGMNGLSVGEFNLYGDDTNTPDQNEQSVMKEFYGNDGSLVFENIAGQSEMRKISKGLSIEGGYVALPVNAKVALQGKTAPTETNKLSFFGNAVGTIHQWVNTIDGVIYKDASRVASQSVKNLVPENAFALPANLNSYYLGEARVGQLLAQAKASMFNLADDKTFGVLGYANFQGQELLSPIKMLNTFEFASGSALKSSPRRLTMFVFDEVTKGLKEVHVASTYGVNDEQEIAAVNERIRRAEILFGADKVKQYATLPDMKDRANKQNYLFETSTLGEYLIADIAELPIPDTDGDGIYDNVDSCPTVVGAAQFNGCPFGIKPELSINSVDMRVNNKVEKILPNGTLVKVYDFAPSVATDLYKQMVSLYEGNTAVGSCTTVNGTCYAGVATQKQYSVISKSVVNGYTVYTAAPVAGNNFGADMIAKKVLNATLTIDKNGNPKSSAANQVVTFTGSLLNLYEPALIEIADTTEYVSFVYETPDTAWEITSKFVPPQGCNVDATEKFASVSQEVEAIVFTLSCDTSAIGQSISSLSAQALGALSAKKKGIAQSEMLINDCVARNAGKAKTCKANTHKRDIGAVKKVKAPAPQASPVAVSATARLTKELRLGMVDPEVKLLQMKLNARGFLVAATGPGSRGNEVESFGALTEAALKRFQSANRLQADGVVGSRTRALLQ